MCSDMNVPGRRTVPGSGNKGRAASASGASSLARFWESSLTDASRRKNLPRVQDAVGIEHCFELLLKRDQRLRLLEPDEFAFAEPDPVLARHRAGERNRRLHDLEDHPIRAILRRSVVHDVD